MKMTKAQSITAITIIVLTCVGLLATSPQPQSVSLVKSATAQQGTVPRTPPVLERLVEDFGATGNGVTDDAPAIQAAINKAGARGVVKFTPGKTYKLNSGLTVIYDEQTWICYGARFVVNFSGVGITIGIANPSSQTNKVWKFHGYGGEIRRVSHDFTAGNIGLRFLNTNMSGWDGIRIRGFEKGLELLGDGYSLDSDHGLGQQYGTFSIDEIGYCKYPIALIARNNAWCNGNYIHGGGRVGYYTDGPDPAGGYAIYMDRDVATTINVINQNTFVGLAFEDAGARAAGLVRMMCQDCLFLGLRSEGFVSPAINNNNNDQDGNIWLGGTELEEPDTDILHYSGGVKSFFLLQHRSLYAALGGAADNKGMVLRNRGDSLGKTLSLQSGDGTERIVLRSDGRISKTTATAIGKYEGASFGGTKSWNPGTILANSTATTTVTISGAAGTGGAAISSNPCIAALSNWKPGLSVTAHIDPAQTAGFNTAVVLVKNETGSDIVVADGGTITVHVHQMDMTN